MTRFSVPLLFYLRFPHPRATQRAQRDPSYKVPALFTSAAYRAYKTDGLSTSALVESGVSGFTFGPTSNDGFGVPYGVLPNALRVCVSARLSRAQQLARYVDTLTAVCDVLGATMQHAAAAKL